MDLTFRLNGVGLRADMSETPSINVNTKKKLARLAAVQALYQISYEQQSATQTIQDYIDNNFISLRDDLGAGDIELASPDAELFGLLVDGVMKNQQEIDEMLAGAFSSKVSGDRMEVLLRMIMRAGVYELYHHSEVSVGIIINDYVDVARAFFNAKEPGLVNAVLDKLAKTLRS